MNIFKIARFMVVYCEVKRNPVTSVKLNYMLFMFQEVMREEHGKDVFSERDLDNFFIWEAVHPTYEKVYKTYQRFGALPIQLKLPYEEERAILQRYFPYKAVVLTCIEKVQGERLFELYEWYLQEKARYNQMAL